jgi:hypothetical protein
MLILTWVRGIIKVPLVATSLKAMTDPENDGRNVTVADGWIEREPERFEHRLWVSKDTFNEGGIIAVQHIALYIEEESVTVEWGNGGELSFYDRDTTDKALSLVEEIMQGGLDG